MVTFQPGDRCKTRDGRPARVIANNMRGHFCVVALVELFDHGNEDMLGYTAEGRVASKIEDPLDLMPDTIEREPLVGFTGQGRAA